MMKKGPKLIMFLIAWISLALGFIGMFLPLLPTTPFAILSAYLFSKSSPRAHAFVIELPGVGPLVKEWEDHKVIPIRAKILSTVMIVILFSYTLIFVQVKLWIKMIVSLIGLTILIFIWSRKSHRDGQKASSELSATR